jgi:phospholipase C
VRHIRFGPDWKKDIVTPQTRFLSDVKTQLANVTWITPTCPNSDHPNCGGGFGPDWVASLVNAIGESKFWNTTAVFVAWDDWGGLYDHVPAPFENFDSLGFRVPLLAISPYAKKNFVSHVEYETASVLRFAEDQFGLAQMAAADKRANDPAIDCFDFTQPPRKFVPIKTNHDARFFMSQPADGRSPDNG